LSYGKFSIKNTKIALKLKSQDQMSRRSNHSLGHLNTQSYVNFWSSVFQLSPLYAHTNEQDQKRHASPFYWCTE